MLGNIGYFLKPPIFVVYKLLCQQKIRIKMTALVQSLPQPFTNVQLELLKVFAHQVSDHDLLDLRDVS